MESFPFFFKIRAVTFAVMMFFSFLWLVLLSVEMFARWTQSDRISQSLMILCILTNAITLVLLPLLILVTFRIWLDAARLLLLFVFHAGSATAATYWSPRVQCPDQTPDDTGVCQLIDVYTTVACWIVPSILVLYSIYFAVAVYLQSRIPVVVEHRPRDIDPEMCLNDSLSSWKEMVKDVVRVQRPGTDKNVPPRPLVLPVTVQTSQTSLLQPWVPQVQSNASRRQSTTPSLSSHFITPHPVPSRHHSLPAFEHGNVTHTRRLLTLPTQDPFATNASVSCPQTPSSYSYSNPSSANPLSQSFNFGSGVAETRSPRDHRWRSKHLSMMPSSSSPGEMQSDEGSPVTPRSTRMKLTKPLPAHYM